MSRNMSLWVRATLAFLVVASLGVRAADAQVFDDFSDLNDTANPTWTHLNNVVGSTGQTWDASGGKYRLHAPTEPPFWSVTPGFEGYGFVGAYVQPTFTDVRISVDIVDFVPPSGQSSYFAVAARLNGNNGLPTSASGFQLHGYSYVYEGSAAGGTGEMTFNILSGAGLRDVGSIPLTLNGGKDYRVIFEVIGNVLHGQVLELDGGGNVVATVADQTRDLDANNPGVWNWDGNPATPDTPFAPYDSGYAGVFGVGHVFLSDADFSIDNFRATRVPEPTSGLLAAFGLCVALVRRRRPQLPWRHPGTLSATPRRTRGSIKVSPAP